MNSKIKEFLFTIYTTEQIKDFSTSIDKSNLHVNTLIPILISSAFYDQINLIILIAWLIIHFISIYFRIYFGKKIMFYLEKDTQLTKKYFYYYLRLVFFIGTLWGLFFGYAIASTNETLRFFVLTMQLALTGGSIITLGPVFIAFILFTVPMTLITIGTFLWMATGWIYYLEPIFIISFLSVVILSSYKHQLLILQNSKNLSLMKQYENITNLSGIVSKTDSKGVITYVNDNLCKISGYSNDELLGQNHNVVRHPDMPGILFKDMWETIKIKKQPWHGIIKNRAKNGDAYYMSSTITPILDTKQNVIEYIALCYDISTIMSDKKQLFDYLEVNKLSVLIMIQIEDYDILEKLYDKDSVEQIENNFGGILLYLLPNECDFQRVYYLENGLYALTKNRRTCQQTNDELEEMLKKFLANVKEYVVKLEKIEYDISVICSYTYGVIQIYEDAKIGIEKAIENKQNLIYADGFSGIEYATALKNIEILRTLKVALDDKKVISFFQPIINNKTRKVEKYESLVRLINENGEIVSPYAFLELAKKGRYYTQVTKIVLENSFKILYETDKEISVNLSTLDIENEDIQSFILTLLSKNKTASSRLVFELLESENVKDLQAVVNFIKKVKPYGVKIAIDDFGSGYSNFERLLQYEPDILKIDGSLILNIQTNQLALNIVETIILFAKKQNIKTVAEFVENEILYGIVKELGIDYSQGYAFGKPEDLLKEF